MANKNNSVIVVLTSVAAISLLISAAGAQEHMPGDAEEILKIHEALLAAHLANNIEGVLAAEADTILVVGRGEVSMASKEERTRQFGRYLERSEFEQYRDVIPPIIRVSADGTMGWLVAQVQIVGDETGDGGARVPIESIWAWIELYEKREGRWVRVGEVSSMKPSRSDRIE